MSQCHLHICKRRAISFVEVLISMLILSGAAIVSSQLVAGFVMGVQILEEQTIGQDIGDMLMSEILSNPLLKDPDNGVPQSIDIEPELHIDTLTDALIELDEWAGPGFSDLYMSFEWGYPIGEKARGSEFLHIAAYHGYQDPLCTSDNVPVPTLASEIESEDNCMDTDNNNRIGGMIMHAEYYRRFVEVMPCKVEAGAVSCDDSHPWGDLAQITVEVRKYDKTAGPNYEKSAGKLVYSRTVIKSADK